eukprot:CAMPEP_0169098442 /NCGR_PEP_ID=MMETSP1015-20121227/20044_1 /TAXON_ID=342587 /ORGANISM="Karlodinium micrum, Strain CCMP2283" /LENGTH=100 /DNA_ID=CAMNT_0009159293 /DNA_START=87 /DNA_END=386 /DNA_ORIENTATION=+
MAAQPLVAQDIEESVVGDEEELWMVNCLTIADRQVTPEFLPAYIQTSDASKNVITTFESEPERLPHADASSKPKRVSTGSLEWCKIQASNAQVGQRADGW